MINYIINTPFGSEIISDENEKSSTKNNLGIIKEMCITDLFTFDGYIKSIKKKTNIKSLIPVIFSNGDIYFPTKKIKDYDNIWINYQSIINYKITHSKATIYFEKNILEIDISKHKFNRLIRQINTIKHLKRLQV